jgi:hypothetical protein
MLRLLRIVVGAENTNAAAPMILIIKENRDSSSYKIMMLFGIEKQSE